MDGFFRGHSSCQVHGPSANNTKYSIIHKGSKRVVICVWVPQALARKLEALFLLLSDDRLHHNFVPFQPHLWSTTLRYAGVI